MRWIAVIPLLVLLLLPPLSSPEAQISDGVDKINEIVTAIDVIDLWAAGLSDAEIATQLSGQRGFDRNGALKKGEGDEQIITNLITTGKSATVAEDVGKLGQHKIAGNRYYGESHFGKAALEYTLASAYATNDYEPYKLRADTYKQYLRTKLLSAAKDNPDKTKQTILEKSRTLLCHAMRADYEKAAGIAANNLEIINGQLFLLKNKMQKGVTDYSPESAVNPYHIQSADKTVDRRRMRQLYNAQLAVTQTVNNVNRAMMDSKTVCDTKSTGKP